jgi:hypothetical protein
MWIFLTNFNESPISNFIKICPLGAKLIHAESPTAERTKIAKLIGTFCEYAKCLNIAAYPMLQTDPMICCEMTVKRVVIQAVSVRKMKAGAMKTTYKQ